MRISIIIPALNEAENIEACLRSIANQHGEFEIIVVDGNSTDGTFEIAKRHAAVISSERGRAIQMNAGARGATGGALLFLHADSTLHAEALNRVRRVLENPEIVGGTFTLKFNSDSLLLKFYAFCTRFRQRYFHYGDQGIFVRRSVFEQLKGFKELPLMEDIDFLLRLRKSGRVSLIRTPVTTSARRFLERGLVRQQLINIVLVVLFILGVNAKTLSKWYRPKGPVASTPARTTLEAPQPELPEYKPEAFRGSAMNEFSAKFDGHTGSDVANG